MTGLSFSIGKPRPVIATIEYIYCGHRYYSFIIDCVILSFAFFFIIIIIN